jgi:hypothetical protein
MGVTELKPNEIGADASVKSSKASATSQQASQRSKSANQPRDSGKLGHVNHFLLCAVVGASAKLIKARAEKLGENLSMTLVTRAVLRSYRREVKANGRLLAGLDLDKSNLRNLNDKVLKEEISRHTQQRIRNTQASLASATWLGDESRIRAAKDALDQAISARDRLAVEILV